jgi:ribosome-associated protein
MRKVCNFTDYFVIASGGSDRKVKAIADGIEGALRRKKLSVQHREGYKEASWIVLDCSSVMAHIFHSRVREFYLLERLWSDAAAVKIE